MTGPADGMSVDLSALSAVANEIAAMADLFRESNKGRWFEGDDVEDPPYRVEPYTDAMHSMNRTIRLTASEMPRMFVFGYNWMSDLAQALSSSAAAAERLDDRGSSEIADIFGRSYRSALDAKPTRDPGTK